MQILPRDVWAHHDVECGLGGEILGCKLITKAADSTYAPAALGQAVQEAACSEVPLSRARTHRSLPLQPPDAQESDWLVYHPYL